MRTRFDTGGRTMFRCLAVSVLLVPLAGPALATELGVEGTRFTLDGEPTFLLGIS
ncbi:MAG: hypothetical protein HQ582_01680, partial [Planctomycetes bacterium]|nr:hypothetical protein [Planctomycetota bacterium]